MSETFAVMASMARKDRKRIAELEAELAELREALTSISTALDAYGVRWCRDVAKDALQEKGE